MPAFFPCRFTAALFCSCSTTLPLPVLLLTFPDCQYCLILLFVYVPVLNILFLITHTPNHYYHLHAVNLCILLKKETVTQTGWCTPPPSSPLPHTTCLPGTFLLFSQACLLPPPATHNPAGRQFCVANSPAPPAPAVSPHTRTGRTVATTHVRWFRFAQSLLPVTHATCCVLPFCGLRRRRFPDRYVSAITCRYLTPAFCGYVLMACRAHALRAPHLYYLPHLRGFNLLTIPTMHAHRYFCVLPLCTHARAPCKPDSAPVSIYCVGLTATLLL